MTDAAWLPDRCAVCLGGGTFSNEHVIPRALGGELCSRLICKDCNDGFGASIEARAKQDPTISDAILGLREDHPTLFDELARNLDVVLQQGGATVRGRIDTTGRVRLRGRRLREADSPITDRESEAVEDCLTAKFQGFPSAPRVNTPDDSRISEWFGLRVETDPDGPTMDPVLALKIAFEFLACCFSETVFWPAFAPARASLRKGALDPSILVERLHADRTTPLHGIGLEPSVPYARVQIRLFGNLAHRVHFTNFGLDCLPVVYTHHLASGDVEVARIEE